MGKIKNMIKPTSASPNHPDSKETFTTIEEVSFTQEEIEALLAIVAPTTQKILEEMSKVKKEFPHEKIDFFVLAREILKTEL